jgi:four helix bundle protein
MSEKEKEKDIEALRQRIYNFVIRIINLVKELPNTLIGNRIGGQLLDAGTSVGANFEEACAAISHADFTHKLGISKKEAYETNYWLRAIRDTQLLPQNRMGDI